ncbi:hypothetical protein ACG2LH_15905 [Zhouia sp. PK063]|uniref:hypothetical protein n=1 Tax=Zhouia sp. PK063 TaxID=3373602 RepID=UPI0037B36823
MIKSILFLAMICCVSLSSAQVGIGTTTPDNSAILEISSTNKGVLFPRIPLNSTSDNSTISSPAQGLLIYNTNSSADISKGFYFWNGGAWDKITTSSESGSSSSDDSWSLTGNSGTNPSTHFLGTTDYKDLIFKVNNNTVGSFDPNGGIHLGINSSNAYRGIALGYGASTSNDEGAALGISAAAAGSKALAVGRLATASGSNAVALGNSSTATGSNALSLGNSANASSSKSVAIGNEAAASTSEAYAIGNSSSASGSNALAIGNTAKASAYTATAIGYGSNASSSSTFAIGTNAQAINNSGAFAVGNSATAQGNNSFSLGKSANSTNNSAYAIGESTTASGQNSMALGNTATAAGQNATAIGYGASAPNANTIIIGNSNAKVGIGTDNPQAKLHIEGSNSFRYADGNQSAGKVLTSDANGNASWQDASSGSSSSDVAFAEIYKASGNTNLSAYNPIDFGTTSYSTGINVNSNNFQVITAGIYRVSYTVTLKKNGSGNANVGFRLATGYNSSDNIPGSYAYAIIDKGEVISASSVKMVHLDAYDMLYVFSDTTDSNVKVQADGTVFSIELIKAD